jgi:protein-S-isoprenylcysteine O-methyltransferase Ste14
MVATTTAASDQPAPRRRFPLWVHILVWTVRLALLFLLIQVARNPWPFLRSRLFPATLLWTAFWTYWGIAARTAAPTKRSESGASTWFHQIAITTAFALLFAPVPGLTGWFLPQRISFLVPAGAIIEAAFALLGVWARRHLGRNWSSAVRIGVDHELVRSGPYRYLRHPIYTALLGMFLGTAISSSQYHALVGLALLVLAYLRKISLEEQILQKTFGAEYEDYRRKSWALVPFLF